MSSLKEIHTCTRVGYPFIPAFSLKKGIQCINFVPKLVQLSVCMSVKFYVNVSFSKLLYLHVATSNFVAGYWAQILCDIDPKVKGQIMYFHVNQLQTKLQLHRSHAGQHFCDLDLERSITVFFL